MDALFIIILKLKMIHLPLTNTFEVALIDDEDLLKVINIRWRLKKSGKDAYYVAASIREGESVRTLYLHRMIIDSNPGEDVHHKDTDTKNNRRNNLQKMKSFPHRIKHLKREFVNS